MIKTYPKMKTLFKLEQINGSNKWGCTNGEILPDTAALHFYPIEELIFTEKIDGTNMGIRITNGQIVHAVKRNQIVDANNKGDQYYIEILKKLKNKIYKTQEYKALSNIIIFGELCGSKIQKGGKYFENERNFLCFDIYDINNNKFFRWPAVEYFCNELNLKTVPIIKYSKDNLDVNNVQNYLEELKSVYNQDYFAEGFVVRYKDCTTPINRHMAKIRRSDFGFK